MKVSNRKKNIRKDFMRQGKKCPECGFTITDGGHFVPSLNLWICPQEAPIK